MKKAIFLTSIFSITILFNACKKDDDNGIEPTPVNEQELITTVKLVFTPTAGGDDVEFTYKDIDGTGPSEPEITNGTLEANTLYNVTTLLLNETNTENLDDPEYNITLEVEEEGDEHQLFYTVGSDVNLSFAYTDKDANNKPIGLTAQAGAGDASNGSLTITLRHQPDKNAAGVEGGDITNAGGETDVEVTFDVTIQ